MLLYNRVQLEKHPLYQFVSLYSSSKKNSTHADVLVSVRALQWTRLIGRNYLTAIYVASLPTELTVVPRHPCCKTMLATKGRADLGGGHPIRRSSQCLGNHIEISLSRLVPRNSTFTYVLLFLNASPAPWPFLTASCSDVVEINPLKIGLGTKEMFLVRHLADYVAGIYALSIQLT